MEQRRQLTFILTATLVMLGYFQLQLIFNPPPPPVEENAVEVVAGEENDAGADDAATAGEGLAAGESPGSDGADDESDVAGAGRETLLDDGKPMTPVPFQRVVLGSLDPTSPYQMVVFFSNRGAAIERIELNNPRYQDIDARDGYLGSLALTDDPQGGCLIGAVAPGSPAALARPLEHDQGIGLRAASYSLDENGMPRRYRRETDCFR